jgi:hypothetical protein
VHGDGEEILKTAWPSILALRPIDLDLATVEALLDDLSRLLGSDDDGGARERLLEAAAVARRNAATPGRQRDEHAPPGSGRVNRRPSPLSS